MASSRLQLISKKLVKPSISTPLSLRNYKLSLMDQFMKSSYVPMAFFYPNLQHKHDVSSILEESLSKTLASYYPFAGRINKNISVTCNDMGVTFLEAKIKCSMSEILDADTINDLDIVFPSLPFRSADDNSSVVAVQVSHFDCGGKALGLCMNHKVGDGATFCNFINHWACVSRQASDETPSPQFNGASVIPPMDDPSTKSLFGPNEEGTPQGITRRFVFDSEKLSRLKAKAIAESGVQNPTRVEAVNALLFKSTITASMACSGTFRPSTLLIAMNMRPLIEPPVANSLVGNITHCAPVSITSEKELKFSKLVSEIRRAKIQHLEKIKGFKRDQLQLGTLMMVQEISEVATRDDMDAYMFSSMCKNPIGNIDFGWGKPIRVSIGAYPSNDLTVLMDNQNADGIDAFVPLEEEVMSVFESDPELLMFASAGSSS